MRHTTRKMMHNYHADAATIYSINNIICPLPDQVTSSLRKPNTRQSFYFKYLESPVKLPNFAKLGENKSY